MSLKITVKELNSFKTVVANSPIGKGETIILFSGNRSAVANKYSLQISETEHLSPYSSDRDDPLSIWQFLNHSCSANCYIDYNKIALVALTDIKEGEEVRFNYNTTEFEIATPFICNCNSLNCYGEIKGFRYLPRAEQIKLTAYLAPHLKRILP